MRVVLRCCPCVFCKNAEKSVAVIIRTKRTGRDILLSVNRQIAESSSMVFYGNSVFCFQQSLKFFKRCGTFCNVRNGVADFFFARFKSGVHGSDALDHKLGFAVVRENFRKERNDWKLDLRVGDGADAIELEIFAEPNPPKRVNRPEACGLRHLAFRVEDVEAAVAELAQMGD